MNKQRIQVYTDDETKRRIDVAAMIRQTSVTEYCLEAIRQQLAEDDLLEQAAVEVTFHPIGAFDIGADLRALREGILARRGGREIELDILDQVRAERDDELLGLR